MPQTITKEKELDYSDWFIRFAPKTLNEVYGQKKLVEYIKKVQKSGQYDKSTLIQSEFGQGKTVIAKIIAASIACKHTNENGEPCLSCPTCESIFNETWGRDVLYLNGEDQSADDIRTALDMFTKTAAMKDRAKVILMDETQALSPEATEAFLQATQLPRKIFFIFTAMDKLQGKKAGALESRCKKWKLQVPSCNDVYDYLVGFYKSHKDIIDINAAPKEFWTNGLKFIADNCEYSFRKALQLFDQCYKGQLFEVEDIKQTLNIVTYEDLGKMIEDLSHGNITSTVFDTVIGKDYQEKFNLVYKILSDAEVVRVFGKLNDEEALKWQERLPKSIANGEHFHLVKQTFKRISDSAYIKRGSWQIELSELVDTIKKQKPVVKTSGRTPV